MAWEGIFNWKIGESTISESFEDWKESVDDEKGDSEFFSVSDFAFEANVLRLQIDYHSWLRELQDNQQGNIEYLNTINTDVNRTFDIYQRVQNAINLAKLDIYDLDRYFVETNIQDEYRYEVVDTLKKAKEYIDEGEYKYQDSAAREMLQQMDRLIETAPRGKLSKILGNIKNWLVRLPELGEITSHEEEVINGDFIKLVKKVTLALGLDISYRYTTIERIYNRYDGIIDKQLFEIQMISIDGEGLNELKDLVLEEIVNRIEKLQRLVISFDEIRNSRCYDKLSQMLELLNDIKHVQWYSKSVKRKLDKWTKGGSCIGIMETPTETFFALSGRNDYIGTVWNGELSTLTEIQDIANKIIGEFPGYKWARLTDNTRRFTEFRLKREYPNLLGGGMYKELQNDWPLNGGMDIETIGSTYGCCERKMQAAHKNDYSDVKTIYCKFAPCDMCIPALAMESDVTIYALAKDYNEWEGIRDNYKRAPLQKYIIKPGLCRIK